MLLYKLKAEFFFFLMIKFRDPLSSFNLQDFRYDAGYGRTGAEI